MPKSYLDDNQKKILLELAKETLLSVVTTGKIPSVEITDSFLKEKGAAFVTLNKNGDLRGCIGYTAAIMPLVDCIQTVTESAAMADPRFPRVSQGELDDINIEISVLTPLKKVKNTANIIVGKHGLMIRKGVYSGLLLPQVATEYGWSRDDFLQHTCQKAGLGSDCWKDERATIYSFEAIVFSEDELNKKPNK